LRFVFGRGGGSQKSTTKMNTTETALEHTDVPVEADWALADIPNSINATGLLAEDLEEYGGERFDRINNNIDSCNCRRFHDKRVIDVRDQTDHYRCNHYIYLYYYYHL
jgi:hypothetical protein